MLHTYIGAEAYRDGLRAYLKQHAYGNTVTTDLWDALERSAGKPVKEFMAAWTGQAGFPLVRAEVGNASVNLSQSRFYLNPQSDRDTTSVWPVPLGAVKGLETDSFASKQADLKAGDTSTLMLNADRGGFYQVMYDSAHLERLGAAVSKGSLQPVARLALLGDTFDAARAGELPTVDALKLLEHYDSEDSAVVWDVIAMSIGGLRSVMDDEELRDSLKPYVRKLATKQRERLGWKATADEQHFDTLMRPLILGMSSLGEEPSVVEEALSRFEAMTKPEDVEPDLRGVVYGTVARTGGVAEFEKLVKLHNDSTNSEDRVTLAAAVTGFRQPELYARALEMITGKDVRLQDAGYWIAYSFSNRHAKRTTWDWMRQNWDWLEANMGKDLSFYRMPNYAARAFSDAGFLDEFNEFFGPMASRPAFERPVAQAIETIQWQSAWRARDLGAVKAYFASSTA
jgi:aminopeptidase 2